MPIKNPLRYPGAKSKLVPYIQQLLEVENLTGCTFYEAYAGSAAVSFGLLEKGVIGKSVINELDPLIYNFWYSVMNHPNELVRMIEVTNITIATWEEMSHYRNSEYLEDKTSLQIGFAGLFLNRTNFSGILKANPLGGLEQTSAYKIDCRFNKARISESILKLANFADRVELHNLDALTFLKNHTKYRRNNNTFVYIDPPYYEKGPSLYRYYYDDRQHRELANFIKKKAYPWLVSYDDSAVIQKMYKKNRKQPIYLDYSVNTKRTAKELLISNLEIPPMSQKNDQKEELLG